MFAIISIACLSLTSCSRDNTPEKPLPGEPRLSTPEKPLPKEHPLSDEEEKRLWDEGHKIAKTICREFGDVAMACPDLQPEACVYVNFSGARATDAVLERLGQMPRIGELHLDGTAITDAGLEHLKGLTQLRYLSLVATKVTDVGLEHLKALTQLKELRLVGTRVSDQGVQKLRQALPNCKIER
jgi:hypothetical protein